MRSPLVPRCRSGRSHQFSRTKRHCASVNDALYGAAPSTIYRATHRWKPSAPIDLCRSGDWCDGSPFSDHPGYHAIFMQVQGTMPELEAIETATDAQLIQNLAIFLSQYYSGLDHADYEAIAFVLVKVGTLLWLSSVMRKSFGNV